MMRAVLEVTRDASDHPTWQKSPTQTARKWLTQANIVATSVTAARDCKNTRLLTRLFVQVHPDTDLCRASGIDGVLIRPQAASRERVVWLKPEHSLKEARDAALLYHGRVIASPKSYGLVITDTDQERLACAQIHGDAGLADQKSLLMRGVPKATNPTDFVAALNQHGLNCTAQAVQSTGKTWCVKVTTRQEVPEDPCVINGKPVIASQAQPGHRFRSRKRKRSRADPDTPDSAKPEAKRQRKPKKKREKNNNKNTNTKTATEPEETKEELQKQNLALLQQLVEMKKQLEDLTAQVLSRSPPQTVNHDTAMDVKTPSPKKTSLPPPRLGNSTPRAPRGSPRRSPTRRVRTPKAANRNDRGAASSPTTTKRERDGNRKGRDGGSAKKSPPFRV